MRSQFQEILDYEEAILLFYEYFKNNEFKTKKEFIDFLKNKTQEKTDIINNLNNLIQKEVFDVIDNLDDNKELIPDILELAEKLFQYELGDKDVYLDIYLSREIYLKMLNYFEKNNDIDSQIVCLYWLLIISTSLNDYESGIFYYKKGKRFLKDIYNLNQESREYVIRILNNKTILLPLNNMYLNNINYSKSVIKYIENNLDKLKISKEKFNKWMFVLNNNIVDSGVLYIRGNKKNSSKEFISQMYKYSKIAKEFEIKVEGEDVFSNLTPLMLEIAYYNGDFKNREEYYEKIGGYLFRLQDSKQSDSFYETKEEIEVSFRELYLIDILDNFDITPKRKVELMDEIFDLIFKTLAKSRMTQDELEFRKYIINYIKIASKVIPREDVIINILNIHKHLHPFTFVHSIEVSSISVVLTEEIINDNPQYFVGLFGFKNIHDVINNKSRIVDFIKFSAFAHDFGKIGIATVVSKLNKLTDYEFEMIKQHTVAGYEILSSAEELKEFSYTALCHHKIADLKGGYPKEIPEEAFLFKSVINIVTTADTISAATDDYGRTYNRRKYFSDVQKEINDKSGIGFNPSVVEVLNKEEVSKKIVHIITDTREDLLFRVFTGKEVAF